MKTLMMAQGSTEWEMARLGRVTASEVGALVTPLWKIRAGEGPDTYLHQKLCERFLGYMPDTGSTWSMDQGNLVEKIALPWYTFTRDTEVRRVGFCATDDGRAGCSPDGLIGEDGGIEAKCQQPPRHLKYLLAGEVPSEYLPQIHFSMLVTGRAWRDFLSFSRQFPSLVVRVNRDEAIQAKLREALAAFFARFDPILARLTAERDAENAKTL